MLHSNSMVALNIWYLLTIYIALISVGTKVDGTILSLQLVQSEKQFKTDDAFLKALLHYQLCQCRGGNDKQRPLGKSKLIAI